MRKPNNYCCICHRECDGSLMRMDKRYTRTRDMITAPEVPRRKSGGIALCHICQRGVYFAKGFNNLLLKVVKNEHSQAMSRMRRRENI